MDICTFNDHYLNPLLDKLYKEANKTIVLLGDLNIDLLNFDTSNHKNTFLDDLASNSPQPQILLTTRIFKNSNTLIDNIFCDIPNLLVTNAISRNISFSTSDHLHNFLHYQISFQVTNYNIMSHEWEYFNNQLFLADFE